MADESLFRKTSLRKNDSVRSNTSPRKLRWSSCLSFVSNKFKRSSKLSSPEQEFHTSFSAQSSDTQVKKEESLLTVSVEPTPSASSQWKPISALSPPPRNSKSKRESVQIPLIDTTHRVNSRPNKRNEALRLSLDAECLQSPTEDHQSDQKSLCLIPPLPSSWQSLLYESVSSPDEDENKRLSLKERRQRKSLLVSPHADHLTLARLSLHDDDSLNSSSSRHEAMLALEGKSIRPIIDTKELDRQFSKKPLHGRMPTVSRIPETPPHHQQFAPSLISVPSTPNSISSSLLIDRTL